MKVICDSVTEKCKDSSCKHKIPHMEICECTDEIECKTGKVNQTAMNIGSLKCKCIPVSDGDVIKTINNSVEDHFIDEGALKIKRILEDGKERKVVDYKILKNSFQNDLEKKVIKYIKDGWTLQGGLIVSSDREGLEYYFQTVVKYG